ncbi:hypothetical protein FHT77_004229 [Rhizobium sp. BK181]|nr:hypothetical protein [Rhizobium sp. BK181]
MTTIYNWLKNKGEEREREGFEVDGVVFDQQAEILRAQAQAEGYDVGDHEALCNSDIAAICETGGRQSRLRRQPETYCPMMSDLAG